MSGIAEILLQSTPLEISGCDLARSEGTARLEALGAKIAIGHDPSHVDDADLLVISSAVGESNPEVEAARAKGVPVIRRAEMLGELMRLKQGIGVAGTHGKTTTTSLTGMVLTEAGFDPTIVVGGQVHILGTNARLGKGEYLVAEADEYDRSFLELTPVVAVITNVEADHLDTYRDLPDILDAFAAFANRVPFYGSVGLVDPRPTLCADDPARGLPRIKRASSPTAVAEASLARETSLEAADAFEVSTRAGSLGTSARLPAGTTSPTRWRRSPSGASSRSRSRRSRGRSRRSRASSGASRGRASGPACSSSTTMPTIPTEIAATLAAARQVYPDRRLVALFQPHLFSRTRDFSEEFGRALAAADAAIVMDVYPSREKPHPGRDRGQLVADAARRAAGAGTVSPMCLKRKTLSTALERALVPGDLLVTLGAGDVVKFGEEYLERGASAIKKPPFLRRPQAVPRKRRRRGRLRAGDRRRARPRARASVSRNFSPGRASRSRASTSRATRGRAPRRSSARSPRGTAATSSRSTSRRSPRGSPRIPGSSA